MKTTVSTNDETLKISEDSKIIGKLQRKPGQSLKPMKSMVRVKSFRPNRINVQTKMRRKATQA